jgi:hypothetical protein
VKIFGLAEEWKKITKNLQFRRLTPHHWQNKTNTLANLGEILGLAKEWKKITRNLKFGRFTTHQ